MIGAIFQDSNPKLSTPTVVVLITDNYWIRERRYTVSKKTLCVRIQSDLDSNSELKSNIFEERIFCRHILDLVTSAIKMKKVVNLEEYQPYVY